MLWNLSDVHVGYDGALAKQFHLDGGEVVDNADLPDLLPKLDVDKANPFVPHKDLKDAKQRKKNNLEAKARRVQTIAAWSPVIRHGEGRFAEGRGTIVEA